MTAMTTLGRARMSLPVFDDNLMVSLAAGTTAELEEACGELIARYGKALQGTIKRCLRHYGYESKQAEQLMDELFQQVIIEIQNEAAKGTLYSRTSQERLKYIFGIARNTVRTSLRSMRRYRNRFVDDDERVQHATKTLQDHGIQAESTVVPDAAACLEKLSGRERDVMLRRLSELNDPPTMKEIGDELGIAEGAVKAYSFSARAKMQECMRKKGHGLNTGAGRQS